MPFQYTSTRVHGKYDDNCTHDHTHQDQSHDNSRVADSAVLHHRQIISIYIWDRSGSRRLVSRYLIYDWRELFLVASAGLGFCVCVQWEGGRTYAKGIVWSYTIVPIGFFFQFFSLLFIKKLLFLDSQTTLRDQRERESFLLFDNCSIIFKY